MAEEQLRIHKFPHVATLSSVDDLSTNRTPVSAFFVSVSFGAFHLTFAPGCVAFSRLSPGALCTFSKYLLGLDNHSSRCLFSVVQEQANS
jgi:hypothetical protein